MPPCCARPPPPSASENHPRLSRFSQCHLLSCLRQFEVHMATSQTSTASAHSLPRVTALRELLGYGDLNPRSSIFSDDIRSFGRKFQTSDGLAGSDLLEWKSPRHQAALEEMTDAYLERDKNGYLFWPDDKESVNFNSLQYSRDHAQCVCRKFYLCIVS